MNGALMEIMSFVNTEVAQSSKDDAECQTLVTDFLFHAVLNGVLTVLPDNTLHACLVLEDLKNECAVFNAIVEEKRDEAVFPKSVLTMQELNVTVHGFNEMRFNLFFGALQQVGGMQYMRMTKTGVMKQTQYLCRSLRKFFKGMEDDRPCFVDDVMLIYSKKILNKAMEGGEHGAWLKNAFAEFIGEIKSTLSQAVRFAMDEGDNTYFAEASQFRSGLVGLEVQELQQKCLEYGVEGASYFRKLVSAYSCTFIAFVVAYEFMILT